MIVNGYGRLFPMATIELPVRERGVCAELPRPIKRERVETLSGVMKALADPTRLEIVAILRESKEPVCICDLVSTFDLSQPTLSHHMAKLVDAGLVEPAGKSGIWCYYSLRTDLPAPVKRLVDAIA